MSGACPVCGSPWESPDIRIFGNIVANDRGAASLGAVQQSIVAALLRGPTPRKALLAGVYGHRDSTPDSSENCLSATICRLNRKLAPMGYRIVNESPDVYGGAVYAIRKIEAGND